MSVILTSVVHETDRTARDLLEAYSGFSLSGFTAGFARELEQGVARDPTPAEAEHGVVFGKKTKSVKRRFAKGSEWVIPRPD